MHRAGQVRDRQQQPHEPVRLERGERVQANRRDVALAAAPSGAALGQLGSRRAQEERGPDGPVGELLQQVEQHLVRPVDVVDHRDDRSPARERREQRTPRRMDLEPDLAGLHRSEGERGILHADAVGERGRRLLGVRCHVRRDQVATERLDALEGDLRRIGVADVREPLQDLGERPIRHAVAVRQASPPHDRRCRIEAPSPPDELGDEPALADARVSVDRHEVRLALLGGALVEAAEELELTVASDHRGSEPRHAALGNIGLPLLEQDGGDGLLLAAELSLSELAEPEAARRPSGAFGHHDPARFGALFEPRGHVDRVAGHHRVTRSWVGRGEHLAGVHARPDLQRDAEATIEFGVDLREALAHPERRPKRPRGVVLVRGRHPERGHDCIADELLDRASLGFDLLAHRPEVGGEHLLEPLGVQAFAQARRARHVREQDRHEAPLLAGRDRFESLERRAARGTEAGLCRNLGPAGGTRRNERRPARRTEAGIVGVLDAACGAGLHGRESTTGFGPRTRRRAGRRATGGDAGIA